MTYRLYNAEIATNTGERQEPRDLTHADELRPLLAPEKLIPASEILRDRTLIPDVAGIYGWWFDTPLPGVPLEGTLAIGKHHLLYVGIAPRKPSSAGVTSKRTLRKRITRDHLGSRIGSSTLRRSLAGLLREELKLVIFSQQDRASMTNEHKAQLSEWMIGHAGVSILSTERAWEIEDYLVTSTSYGLPLNLKGSKHRFQPELTKLRLQFDL